MKNKWKKFSTGERAAIIGGIFTFVTAVFISSLTYIRSNAVELKIISCEIVHLDKSIGTEIIFWNKSSSPVALTSINIVLRKIKSTRVQLAQAIYYINANIYLVSRSSGYFMGNSVAQKLSNQKNFVTYPITGEINISKNMNNWNLYLKLPIREEIPSGKNQSIIIKIPDSIPVTESQKMKLETAKSNFNLQKILFSKYFDNTNEPVDIFISAVYADNKKSYWQSTINLRDME